MKNWEPGLQVRDGQKSFRASRIDQPNHPLGAEAVLGHQHEAGQHQIDILPRKEDQRCPGPSCTVWTASPTSSVGVPARVHQHQGGERLEAKACWMYEKEDKSRWWKYPEYLIVTLGWGLWWLDLDVRRNLVIIFDVNIRGVFVLLLSQKMLEKWPLIFL